MPELVPSSTALSVAGGAPIQSWMERLLRGRIVSVLALIAASATGPAAVLHYLAGGKSEAPIGYTAHFFIIAVSSLIAASAAIALTVAGTRRGDGRTVLVGVAFSAMTALLAVHGISTEGVLLRGESGVSAFAGGAALPVGGTVLALSALPSLRGPDSIGPLLRLQGALLASICALGTVGILFPESVPAVPRSGGPAAIALVAIGLLLFGMLSVRAVRTYVLTRRLADLLVVIGTAWLGTALVPQLIMTPWSWGWWTGHVLEVMGIALVGGPVALDLYRGAQSRPLAGDLRGTELVAAEEAFLGAHVRSLLVHLAMKDTYTEVHTRRVALRCVQVGELLAVSAGRLRSLAIGALLHDIGKLSVPVEVLQKPGPLNDDEYAVIRRHPGAGARLISELGGFPTQVRRLVQDHHERLDGSGYPNGVRDEQLDLETRILAVCDVYDALISKRVYREAWTREQALALLHEQSGKGFDPLCVNALEQVLKKEEGLYVSVGSDGTLLRHPRARRASAAA
jgi:hypothetical protein